MDEDRIGLVLAKTSELRSKIIVCMRRTSCGGGGGGGVEKEGQEGLSKESEEDQEVDVEEEEAESLLNIRDALEFLEGQLSSLQALQQQQWYEKESALAEIEFSQKKLLQQLKDYKGKDLEVIHEAIVFAGETDHNNDLLLPPYPSRPSHSQDTHLTTFHKFPQNGGLKHHHDNPNKLESDRRQSTPQGPLQRAKSCAFTVAKTALTVLGVITVLSLAGFEPRLRKRDNQFKLAELLQLVTFTDKMDKGSGECPPGKVPIMEDGEMRCVVKERVEVPFESAVSAPDVSYGFG